MFLTSFFGYFAAMNSVYARLAIRLSLYLISIVFLTQCVPNNKLVYLQKGKEINPNIGEVATIWKDYKLQPGDVLSIRVLGTDQVALAPFNLDQSQGMNNAVPNTVMLYINGYSVDPEGNINFPELGYVNVAGKTLEEVTQQLSTKLGSYLQKPTVKIKLVSYKIAVLGEVRTPGYYYFFNDRVTIFEAIGMAGDLTDVADRSKVKIVRNTAKGVEVKYINLLQADLLQQETFFMSPNDMIYVQPLPAKNFRINLPALSFATSGLSLVLIIISLLR
jgi:polysaccharide export outer membrane protein